MENQLMVVSAVVEDQIWEMLESQAKIIRTLEKVEGEKGKLEEELKKMKNAKKVMGDWIQELEKFASELTISKRDLENKLEEIQVKEKLVVDELARLNVKVAEQKLEITRKFVECFMAMQAQIKVLCLNADLSQMGYFKEVIHGKIMDEEEDEVIVGENNL
ncbi:hypothetical protein VNO78_26861 [Psophocarpus tetragonolobus]|uniref:Uncharacterized protein n=1 Tax=Psophocarpus tetragonolobus TaxID=3891 RepID=A0AAN9RZV5_PSOTE